MLGPRHETRPATRHELPRITSCLVGAFIADPLARFAWPSVHTYLQAMPRVARCFVDEAMARGRVDVSAELDGAALWLPPGVRPQLDGIAAIFRETVDAGRLDDLLASFGARGPWLPRTPHAYLLLLGVEPNAQGQGLGSALMRDALARCDRERTPAYAFASNPRTIPFYQRHGFRVTGEIRVGAAPVIFPIFRP